MPGDARPTAPGSASSRRPFMSRFQGFLLVSGILIAVVVAAAGFAVGRFFEQHLLADEADQTAEVVQNQSRQHLVPEDFTLTGPGGRGERFEALLEGLPRVFRIKAFDREGRIVWSNEPRLIGLQFPDNSYLTRALQGHVTTVLEAPRRSEHVYERERRFVAEAYVPVVLAGDDRAVGVIESYKDMTAVVEEIRHNQRIIWTFAGATGLFLYVALAVVVWRASASELRAIRELERRNSDLTLLQRFTRSVMQPLDLGEVAATVVESAGSGLGLRRAALCRADGQAVSALAAWPRGAVMPAALAMRAAENRARTIEGHAVALPLLTRQATPHVFVAEFTQRPAEGEAALRTLEIMLDEAAIALSNARMVTEIREAHERLAAILAGIADRMVIVDRDMRVVWLNTVGAREIGGGIGRPCFELMGAEPGICEQCPAVRTFRSGGVERGVRAECGTDGRTRYLDLVTAPLRDASGEIHQVLEVARDVTDLVEMEERLKSANQALLDAQAKLVEKERLAAVGAVVVGLHHAILNPLTGILGALQIMRDPALDAGAKARALAEAEAEVRKVEQIIRRLPDIERADVTAYVGGTTMLDLERLWREEHRSR